MQRSGSFQRDEKKLARLVDRLRLRFSEGPLKHTVAGRSPAKTPVDMVNIPLLTMGFIHPKWLAGFLPSTVPAWFFFVGV